MNALVVTQHARIRMQQRAIPTAAIDLLLRFGKRRHAMGTIRLDFDKRARRRVAEHFAPSTPPYRLMNIYAVVNGDVLVTIGHRTKRFSWN